MTLSLLVVLYILLELASVSIFVWLAGVPIFDPRQKWWGAVANTLMLLGFATLLVFLYETNALFIQAVEDSSEAP